MLPACFQGRHESWVASATCSERQTSPPTSLFSRGPIGHGGKNQIGYSTRLSTDLMQLFLPLRKNKTAPHALVVPFCSAAVGNFHSAIDTTRRPP